MVDSDELFLAAKRTSLEDQEQIFGNCLPYIFNTFKIEMFKIKKLKQQAWR